MTLTLALVAAVGVIWFAERSLERLKLAITGLCFSPAVLLFVVADFGRDSAVVYRGGSYLRSVLRQVQS